MFTAITNHGAHYGGRLFVSVIFRQAVDEEVRTLLMARRSNSIDYTRNRLCRVFNEAFSRVGRFYQSWWPVIPSELPQYITINDQSTSELDNGRQHLLLLYALKGEEFPWLRGDTDP